MVRGLPCMCIKHTPQPDSRATSSICGSPSRAVTSLTTSAPAASASRATTAFEVSIDSGTGACERRASMTGRTLASSVFAATLSLPGRVLSPPISMISAPSAASRSAWSTAADISTNWPPSEKLSGVTLTIPITSGRRPRRSRAAQLPDVGAGGKAVFKASRQRSSGRVSHAPQLTTAFP